MSDPELMLKQIGEPIVNAAFDDFLASKIPSEKGREILTKFREQWKDYSRPSLIVLSCEAVGGNPKLVEPVAKALILISGAFDIHDDIIDKSYERTEKRIKTLVGTYGYEAMLLAGDALMIGAFSYLPSMHGCLPHEKVMRITELIKNGSYELGASAFEEFRLIRSFDVTPEQYLEIVRMKAADVESYTKIGAIIGCDDEQKISAFGKLGRLIGMVVILRDDIEDTFDDKFELRSRILNESYPLPIIFSLSNPKLVPALQSFYSSLSDESLDKILEIVEESKGFEKTKEVIENLISQIRNILQHYKSVQKIASLFK